MLYNEVLLREAAGESPKLDEYVRRFPQFSERLTPLFEVHRALESDQLLGAVDDRTPLAGTLPGCGTETAKPWPTVAGYEIVSELGRGGMGHVYRARDTRLDRDVAVKVLPELFAHDPERRARFEREAKAVAALSHPNIRAIHDYGTHGAVTYAVMELLEGETLGSRLSRGPLPWREAIAVGAAVAEGLAAAHAKGIVHRDLKPENIFLTADGQVKVLDFGLARVEPKAPVHAETVSYHPALTDPGTVFGTVGYMSPEQVRAQTVDARSDIFSLGCVLYEMVSGRRPFDRETAAETQTAILREEPPDLVAAGAIAPIELGQLICCCLEKSVELRRQTLRDLAFALHAIASQPQGRPASPAPRSKAAGRRVRNPIDSLAILPLVNDCHDPNLDYLSDGVTESIIHIMSRLPNLRVMARNTVFRYKGRGVDAQAAGRSLHVRAVFTGHMLARGSRLIIKAELVDVADGAQLWSEQYSRQVSEIFLVEEAIAKEIADTLRLRLSGEQKRRLRKRSTENIEAYQLYLKGRYHWNKRTAEGLKKSIKLFEQAIDIDPTYALAYTGVADAYHNLGGWGHLPFHEAYPRSRAAAIRALAIDEGLSEAHVSLAMVEKEYDWDWPAAGRDYERALQLNPNYAVAYQWYGEYLAALCRHSEAIAALRQAINLDPLSLIIHSTLGRHGYYFARQYDEAIAQFRKTLEMEDTFWVAHFWLGWTYATIGRLSEAFVELQTARRLDDNLEIVAALGYAHGLAGQTREAEQVVDELQQLARTRYVSPMLGALVAIGMGEYDEAFGWLEKAYEDGAQMLSELKVEPAFDPIRADPRFADLLGRVGLQANSVVANSTTSPGDPAT
jgi:serine/threonine-protein kinase